MPLLTTHRPFFFLFFSCRFVVCRFCSGWRSFVYGDEQTFHFCRKNKLQYIDLFRREKWTVIFFIHHFFLLCKLIPPQVDNRTLTSPNKKLNLALFSNYAKVKPLLFSAMPALVPCLSASALACRHGRGRHHRRRQPRLADHRCPPPPPLLLSRRREIFCCRTVLRMGSHSPHPTPKTTMTPGRSSPSATSVAVAVTVPPPRDLSLSRRSPFGITVATADSKEDDDGDCIPPPRSKSRRRPPLPSTSIVRQPQPQFLVCGRHPCHLS